MEVTRGHLLGGRIAYGQPRTGFRSGLEPVLLASAVPASPGERAFEAGVGAGPALLCLGARVPGLALAGMERDAEMASLCRANLAANCMRGVILEGDFEAAFLSDAQFDHAFANPPYHGPGTPAASPEKEAAKRGAERVALWIERLAALLRPGGSLTLVLAAACWPSAGAAFEKAGCGAAVLFPLWPKPGVAAKLALLQARRTRRTRPRIAPGLTLHTADGVLTDEAEAILRGAANLKL